jgi:hypothetical protein
MPMQGMHYKRFMVADKPLPPELYVLFMQELLKVF